MNYGGKTVPCLTAVILMGAVLAASGLILSSESSFADESDCGYADSFDLNAGDDITVVTQISEYYILCPLYSVVPLLNIFGEGMEYILCTEDSYWLTEGLTPIVSVFSDEDSEICLYNDCPDLAVNMSFDSAGYVIISLWGTMGSNCDPGTYRTYATSGGFTLFDIELDYADSSHDHPITFKDGSKTLGTQNNSDSNSGSGTYAIAQNNPVKSGYSFKGWSLTNGGAVVYQKGSNVTVGTSGITLYAVWEEVQIKGEFTWQKGTALPSATYVAGSPNTPVSNTSYSGSVPGVTLSLIQDGQVARLKATGTPITPGDYTIVYTANGVSNGFLIHVVSGYNHTISYNANGGTNAPASTVVNDLVNGDSSVTVASGAPTRTNFHFVGWSITTGYTGTVYKSGNTLNVGPNATTTLYAIWEPVLALNQTSASLDGITNSAYLDVAITKVVDAGNKASLLSGAKVTYTVSDTVESGVTKLVSGTDYTITNGKITFSDSFTASKVGTHTVKITAKDSLVSSNTAVCTITLDIVSHITTGTPTGAKVSQS